jgi:hypothetical protein
LAVILPTRKQNKPMGFQEIKSLLIPILLIGFGLFIKTTKNENYQNVKSWWKILIILGIISLILKVVNLFF